MPQHLRYRGVLPKTISCDLENAANTNSGTLIAVANYDGGAGEVDYSIWGTDGAGNSFGCYFDDSAHEEIWSVEAYGTDQVDTMLFEYSYCIDKLYDPRGSGIFVRRQHADIALDRL